MWFGQRLTTKQKTSRPDQSWPEIWRNNVKECQAEGEAKVVAWKSSILTPHENCTGSISLTLRIRNTMKPSRMLVKNWKHQLLLLCFVKLWRRIVGVMHLIKYKQDLRAFWNWWIYKTTYRRILTKSSWRSYCRRRSQFIKALHFGSQIYSYASSFRIPAAKAAVDKEWEKWRFSAWNLTKVKSKKKRWSMKQGRRAQKFTLHHWWTQVIWEMLECRQSTKKSEVELYSKMILWVTNVIDIISRLPSCDGQAADAVSAYTQVKKDDFHKLCIRGSEIGMSRRLDSLVTTQMA